ncbi:MAG: hypothetical protein HQ490_07760 [Lutibacter sp.]|nr:hypothetical protein [Lutibacter sp.]
MKNKNSLVIILFIITATLFSQTDQKFIDSGSVKNQFDYLINESYSYKEFKYIKINWLTKLETNVIDSLLTSKKQILISDSTINSQKITIDSLKTSMVNSEKNISTLTNEKQNISLFNIQFSKSFFKTLMFLIIGSLIIFLIYFITKFKQSYSAISQAKNNLEEVEKEFEKHRQIALEREQKVMRKLQDELNKQKKE